MILFFSPERRASSSVKKGSRAQQQQQQQQHQQRRHRRPTSVSRDDVDPSIAVTSSPIQVEPLSAMRRKPAAVMITTSGGGRGSGGSSSSSSSSSSRRGGGRALTDRREQRNQSGNGLSSSRLSSPLRSCSTRQLAQFFAASDANIVGGGGNGDGYPNGQEIAQTRLGPVSQRGERALRPGAAGGGIDGTTAINAEYGAAAPEWKLKDVRRPREASATAAAAAAAAAIAEEESGGLWATGGGAGRGVRMTGKEDRKNNSRRRT